MASVAISIRVIDKPMWIMSFPQYYDDDFDDFYDQSQKKIYGLYFPELRGSTVCYARDGWLLLSKTTVDHVFFFCPYTHPLRTSEANKLFDGLFASDVLQKDLQLGWSGSIAKAIPPLVQLVLRTNSIRGGMEALFFKLCKVLNA
ncbi:hypothetical protein RD792_014249 [Penstemon davidsonii]|uniref:Uncharacterized protein n=1 Tax=Penstemon davidsonii TaxID=160366 RepID=A0ABR0CQG6_9LAMI|nr:hypothetical protein RD792_014249 [Penstemon davidsonii]